MEYLRTPRQIDLKPVDYDLSDDVYSLEAEQKFYVPVFVLMGSIVLCFLLVLGCSTKAHASEDVYLSYIRRIESSDCRNMIGDGGKAIGCYQLHAGVVLDYNKANGTKYTHAQMLDPNISMNVANWYLNKRIPQMLRHYKKPDTLENRLTAYNMGIGSVVKGKVATKYINKYRGMK